MKTLSKQAREILDALWNSVSSRKIPNTLLHYTDDDGALGILNKEKLWLSNARYLNDAQEIRLTINLVSKVIKKAFDQVGVPKDRPNSSIWKKRDFLHRVRYLTEIISSNTEVYVVCFCKNDDLLSQWRGYADRGGGFAIGFDSEALLESARLSFPRAQVFFSKVDYDHKEWESKVLEACHAVGDSLITNTKGLSLEETSDLSDAHASHLAMSLLHHAPFMKHHGFYEEDEWRMAIVLQKDDDGIKFRRVSVGLLPYLEMNLNSEIVSVRIGPRKDQQISLHSLNLLTRKKVISLDVSSIPFR